MTYSYGIIIVKSRWHLNTIGIAQGPLFQEKTGCVTLVRAIIIGLFENKNCYPELDPPVIIRKHFMSVCNLSMSSVRQVTDRLGEANSQKTTFPVLRRILTNTDQHTSKFIPKLQNTTLPLYPSPLLVIMHFMFWSKIYEICLCSFHKQVGVCLLATTITQKARRDLDENFRKFLQWDLEQTY